MRTSGRFRVTSLLVALALVTAACGDDSDDAAPPVDTDPGLCPIGALDDAEGPVQITYWHSMQDALGVALEELVDDFHESQDRVRVRLVNQTSYDDTLTRYLAGLGTGDLPDLAQIEDTATRVMIDSQSALPAQACVEADDLDVSDVLPRVVDYYTVEDVLWPVPFNVSNPILYYNKAAFEAAGLDPDDPPDTLEGVREAAEAIVGAGVTPRGVALPHNPWLIEQWLALANEEYANNGNGREDRATELQFDSETALEIFTWWNDMRTEGLLLDAGPSTGNIDHYFALGNEEAAMTIDTSAALGPIFAVLGAGQFPDVELGVGVIPGPSRDGGVLVGGAANYVVDSGDAVQMAAAFEFARFLIEPDSQASWMAGTGYIPISQAAVDLPLVEETWAETPERRLAFDQLVEGATTVATAGPVIGDYRGIRDVIEESIARMLGGDATPEQALADAKRRADEVLQSYNQRVG